MKIKYPSSFSTTLHTTSLYSVYHYHRPHRSLSMTNSIRLRHRPHRCVIVHGLPSVCIPVTNRSVIGCRTPQQFGIPSHSAHRLTTGLKIGGHPLWHATVTHRPLIGCRTQRFRIPTQDAPVDDRLEDRRPSVVARNGCAPVADWTAYAPSLRTTTHRRGVFVLLHPVRTDRSLDSVRNAVAYSYSVTRYAPLAKDWSAYAPTADIQHHANDSDVV